MNFLSSFFQKRREAAAKRRLARALDHVARKNRQTELEVADAKARYDGATAKLAPLGARLTLPTIFREETPAKVRGYFTLNGGDALYGLTATPTSTYVYRV